MSAMKGLEKQCCSKERMLTQSQELQEGGDFSCCVPVESTSSNSFFSFFTRLTQANLAKWTAGISPAAIGSS
ncbi:TPA: PHA synthase, partial [Legionella pneumophila]|nr:PHA synthase [Legionella pneumophila]